MADGTLINEQISDDRTVEIAGDESSAANISELTKKVTDLELQNEKIVGENEEYKQRIEELKGSVNKLTAENVEFKRQVDDAKSEVKVLGSVATRAAELEGEVSRLQHDLVSAMSEVQESNAEISNLKRDLEGIKEKEKDKDVKLEAIEKERGLLLAKVGKLEGEESILRDESEGKENEIRSLKNKIQDLEAVVGNNKNVEKLKHELEKTIEQLKGEISLLEITLDEKEKLISGFEIKERAVIDGVNGNGSVEGEKKGLISDLKNDWVLVGGSTVAAVALIGVVCYIHAAKKN